jgi:tyrosine-protein kinase Etk/Wzc
VGTEVHPPVSCAEAQRGTVILLWAQLAWRRRRAAFGALVALAVVAMAVALLLPSLYTSTVLIMPPQQSSSSSAALMSQLGSIGTAGALSGGLSIKNPNDLQVSLLKSRTLEDAMVARFHLSEEYHKRFLSTTRKRWEKMTKIDNGLKDGLIRISVSDRDPRRAAGLAAGWLEEYERLTASMAVTEASQRRLFFEREQAGAHASLTEAEEKLKDAQQRSGVLEIDGQSRAMIASAAMLRAQLAAKQVEIRAMREFAADQNPDLTRAEQELKGLDGQLAAMGVDNDNGAGDLVSGKGKITQAGLDYTRALREVKYREAMYELLTRQYEAARVEEARQGPLIQVVDPAAVPDRPTYRISLWVGAGALLLALPLMLAAAWIAEAVSIVLRHRRLSESWKSAVEQFLAGEAA